MVGGVTMEYERVTFPLRDFSSGVRAIRPRFRSDFFALPFL